MDYFLGKCPLHLRNTNIKKKKIVSSIAESFTSINEFDSQWVP